MRCRLAGIPWLVFAAGSWPLLAADDFTPPDPPANLAQLGHRIQRTMTLLATSTPARRHRVRILFYGQSVTAGRWSAALADDLRRSFPDADLEIENRAIGGYEAPNLIKTADYDLYPYYPDLLIFHVYGGVRSGEQEEIIKRVRQRTAAEVLLWTSHFRWPKDLARDGDPATPAAKALTDADEERAAKVREIAEQYGCELAEVREAFRAYLGQHSLYPKDTLADSVHPNNLGHFLIRSLLRPYLRYDPSVSPNVWQDLAQTVPSDDARVQRLPGGGLRLTCEGNRVDALAATNAAGAWQVKVDGRAPSSYPELYYHARPSAAPGVWWPAINRLGSVNPLVPERWTLRILEYAPERKLLRFEVSGSVTGPDGTGEQGQRFVSNSGRVVIEPGDWNIAGALAYKKISLPADYQVTWETRPLGVDLYQPVPPPDPSREAATTLFQGLANGPHTVELIPAAPGAVPPAALRVYRPPLR